MDQVLLTEVEPVQEVPVEQEEQEVPVVLEATDTVHMDPHPDLHLEVATQVSDSLWNASHSKYC